jgi:hypothetical protein
MTRVTKTTLALALLLTAAAPPLAKADRDAANAAIDRLYAPYRQATPPQGDTDPRLYSARTRALIAQWKATRPADELTDLSDADWLCQCQDWDWRTFRIVARTLTPLGTGRLSADIGTDLGGGARQRLRLILVREGGAWRVDDLHFKADARSALRARLTAEIASFK